VDWAGRKRIGEGKNEGGRKEAGEGSFWLLCVVFLGGNVF
jgi:hypothetical protein